MKQILILFGIVVLTATFAMGQEPCVRHSEAEGGFSFCPPAGWLPRFEPSAKYRGFRAPSADKAAATLTVKDEASKLTLAAFAETAASAISAKDSKLKRSDLTTDSNLKGIRLAHQYDQANFKLREQRYFFDAPGGKKLIFTCTFFVADPAREKECDDAVRTLRFDR